MMAFAKSVESALHVLETWLQLFITIISTLIIPCPLKRLLKIPPYRQHMHRTT